MTGPIVPTPAWIWIKGHGWIEGIMTPDGVCFEDEPPEMAVGSKILAVSREPGELPPGPVETAQLLIRMEGL